MTGLWEWIPNVGSKAREGAEAMRASRLKTNCHNTWWCSFMMSSNRHSRNCLPRAFAFSSFLICFNLFLFSFCFLTNAKSFYFIFYFDLFYLLDKTCSCGVSHFNVLLGGVSKRLCVCWNTAASETWKRGAEAEWNRGVASASLPSATTRPDHWTHTAPVAASEIYDLLISTRFTGWRQVCVCVCVCVCRLSACDWVCVCALGWGGGIWLDC